MGWRQASWVKKGKPNADDRCPAVMVVTWYESQCFALWLGGYSFAIGERKYHTQLPTEAQKWEYGCRAGHKTPEDRNTPFTFAEGHPGLAVTPDVCNFDGNYLWPSGTELPPGTDAVKYRDRTIPVDGLPANPWGFYQMHGNAWEWCRKLDCTRFYRREKGEVKNPYNPEEASFRVLRGGSWIYFGWRVRSALHNQGAARRAGPRLRLPPGRSS